jgi:hypothetical protein
LRSLYNETISEFLVPGLLTDQVNEFHAARQRLSANVADSSSFIKGLVVRAEDARMQCDMCVGLHIYIRYYIYFNILSFCPHPCPHSYQALSLR